MKKHLINQINKLKDRPNVDKKTVAKFIKRIDSDKALVVEENDRDHICIFFVPVHIQTNSIYLVDHIKGKDWMPPGGHNHKGEKPVDTVRREFIEELSHELTDEKVEPFDLTIKYIDNPKHNCKIHYDFWYLVFIEKHNFKYCKKEFYKAKWVTIKEASNLSKHQDNINVYNKIAKLFFK